MDVHGMKLLVQTLLRMKINKFFNGHEKMAVLGVNGLQMLLYTITTTKLLIGLSKMDALSQKKH